MEATTDYEFSQGTQWLRLELLARGIPYEDKSDIDTDLSFVMERTHFYVGKEHFSVIYGYSRNGGSTYGFPTQLEIQTNAWEHPKQYEGDPYPIGVQEILWRIDALIKEKENQ